MFAVDQCVSVSRECLKDNRLIDIQKYVVAIDSCSEIRYNHVRFRRGECGIVPRIPAALVGSSAAGH